MRGNATRWRNRQFDSGFIPARAGGPGSRSPRSSACRVHPRARGGTRAEDRSRALGCGSSPRRRALVLSRLTVKTEDGPSPRTRGGSALCGQWPELHTAYPRRRSASRKLLLRISIAAAALGSSLSVALSLDFRIPARFSLRAGLGGRIPDFPEQCSV